GGAGVMRSAARTCCGPRFIAPVRRAAVVERHRRRGVLRGLPRCTSRRLLPPADQLLELLPGHRSIGNVADEGVLLRAPTVSAPIMISIATRRVPPRGPPPVAVPSTTGSTIRRSAR